MLQSIPDPPNTDAGSKPFTLAEVKVAVKFLKNNKACGWDKIAAETLKAGEAPMRQLLLKITNVAWTEGKDRVRVSFQEGRQTQSKQLQSNHPTLHTRESILQDEP